MPKSKSSAVTGGPKNCQQHQNEEGHLVHPIHYDAGLSLYVNKTCETVGNR